LLFLLMSFSCASSVGSETISTLTEVLCETLFQYPTKLIVVELKVPFDAAANQMSACDGAAWLETPDDGPGARAGRLAARCVLASGATAAQVALISFDVTALVAARAEFDLHHHKGQCVMLATQTTEAGALAAVRWAATKGFQGIDLRADLGSVTAAVVKAAESAGLPSGVWVWVDRALGPESDSAETWSEFQRRGVALFTSDIPPSADRWLESNFF
jgi:hypothetical protein